MKSPQERISWGLVVSWGCTGSMVVPMWSWQKLLPSFLPRRHHRRASDVVRGLQHRPGEQSGKGIGGQAAQLAFLVDPHQAAIGQVDALQPATDKFVQLTGCKAGRSVCGVNFAHAPSGGNQ